MSLPPVLAPWAPSLRRFSPALSGVVGPWLGRLWGAVGPRRSEALPGEGDPDGYQGLARRGPPHRLLAGDWLLAEEAPDEFLRRAAEGELSYLALARTTPAAARRCVVLFDAGPELLGAPRLGLLALLVVFERRCREAGAELAWGALQSPRPFNSGLSPVAIRHRLLACASSPAAGPSLEGWRERLEAEDELWLVGDPGLRGRLGEEGASWLTVEDTLEPGAGALEVEARRPGAPPRRVRLPLPPSEDCARALADPFARPRAARPAADGAPPDALWLSSSGRRLAWLGPGAVHTVELPQVPGGPATPGYRHRPERLVAMGWWRQSLQLLSGDAARLARRGNPYNHHPVRLEVLDTEGLVELSGPGPRECFSERIWRSGGAGYDLACYLLGDSRTLVQMSFDPGETAPIRVLAQGVEGMGWTHRGLTLVYQPPGSPRRLGHFGRVQRDLAVLPTPSEGAGGVAFGYGGASHLLAAAATSEERWIVLYRGHTVDLSAPKGSVVGPALLGGWSEQSPGLLVLEDSTLSLRGLRGTSVIARDVAASPRPALATLGPWICWVSLSGEVVMFNLEQSQIYARLSLGGR